MKLAARAIAGFIARPDPAVRAVLVYGPDSGLVRERADAIARTVVDDLADPFRVAELSTAAIAGDPARLSDEVMARALTGGRRLIRVRDAADAMEGALAALLADAPETDSLILLEAGDLGPRARLRLWAEKSDLAAAIPCYVEEAGDVGALARTMLAAAGMKLERDAEQWLGRALTGDRLLQRREIEKLILYMGADTSVTLTHVTAAIGDSGAVALDDLAEAAASGDQDGLARALERLQGEGESPVAMLRAAQRHLMRLHLAAAKMEQGQSADAAIAALRPPLFWKQKAPFARQLRAWSRARLEQALEGLTEAESRTKQTGWPADLVAARALTAIATMARAGQR